ncbi:MAG TPA: CBS domain-containing protein [Chthoniobacteraceae bacterium]|jgi:CBS domain-containing protein|nr:CBS domain-containing protein [Chthoniobacteraceae bacterium]
MTIPGIVGEILANKQDNVWTVQPNETVLRAIQIMAEKNIGALPVVDRGRLVGVISERDYTRKVVLQGRVSRQTPVQDIMSAHPQTASPDATVVDCMQVMTKNKIRHLPVLDGDALVGIVSIGDLVNWIISAQNVAIDQLEN